MKLSYRQRVRNGAEFLDDFLPDWWELVDTSILNVLRGDVCVLGQVFGDYSEGLHHVWDEGGVDPWSNGWQQKHGFNTSGEEALSSDDEFGKVGHWLTKRWTEEINTRKGVSK